MKSIFLRILLIINLFFIFNCKAQTTTDYIVFYNDVVPKLNSIVPNKTQFYGQNFSNFYNELQNKNITVTMLSYDYKDSHGTKYYVLRLYFNNAKMWRVASDNSFQFPSISVIFENEIPKQIEDIVVQHHGQWNLVFEQFFSNMKIEKIVFIGMNGYESFDNSLK